MRISDWSSDVCSSDLYGWSGITLMTMPCACWTAREQWARANRLVPLPMARHAIALLLSGAERDVDDSRRARIRNFGEANRVGLASAWHKQSNTHPHNRVDQFWRSASLSWSVCNEFYSEEIANL